MIDFGDDEVRAAAVAIDCHRGHQDSKVGTMLVIYHVMTDLDVTEIRSNPRWRSLADSRGSARKMPSARNSMACQAVKLRPDYLLPRAVRSSKARSVMTDSLPQTLNSLGSLSPY